MKGSSSKKRKFKKNKTKAPEKVEKQSKQKKRISFSVKDFSRVLVQKVRFRKRSLIPIFLLLDIVIIALIIHFSSLLGQGERNPSAIMGVQNKSFPIVLKEGGELDVSSHSYIIYEPESRVTVVEKNSHFRFAPASTVKILTALIALETYDPDEVVEASNLSVVLGSKMGLFEGERISVQNLLYGLMLPSGNDAAYVLANHYPTGYLGFMQRMNEIVTEELRLNNSYFIDPAGLDDRNYTTAYDLARIAAYAMKKPEFREIVRTGSKTVTNEDGTIVHELNNLNELLQLENVTGVKTGFTEEAQGVLVTSAEVKGKEFILVVLKSEDRFFDTLTLMRKVLSAVDIVTY